MISEIITTRLADFLNGIRFEDWCELIVDDIADETVPIDLERYLKFRNVHQVRVNCSLSYPGKLSKYEDGFIIELNKKTDLKLDKVYRFILAHEIAHTYQFKQVDGKWFDFTYFLPGSIEAEYFSNRLARSLLVPRKSILSRLPKGVEKISTFQTVQLIRTFAAEFNVSYKVISYRLINDLDYFKNIALFRFIKYSNSSEWQLLDRYLSNFYSYNSKFFIPYPRVKSQTKDSILPRCHGLLNIYLNSIRRDMPPSQALMVSIDSDHINDSPLRTFVRNFRHGVFHESTVLLESSKKANSSNWETLTLLLDLSNFCLK